MATVTVVFLIVAIVLWLLAAIPAIPSPIAWGWLGMFFYGLSMVVK